MQRKLTVSQLNNYVSGVFEDELVLHNVTVCGEIFECKNAGAKTYLTLKEGECALSCVYFGSSSHIVVGCNVEATGTVSFYAKTGKVSFLVDAVMPVGEGALSLQFLKLKEKLAKEGLFENRPPLPEKINKIAVITSESGAVIHDIVSVVKVKNPLVSVCVYDVRVQGQDSALTIAQGIADVNKNSFGSDVIIVARGGGSAQDLQSFNTEMVARAVANSVIPIVSAVGHQTDYTLCDLCASVRAGTPSIAADIVTAPLGKTIDYVKDLLARVGELMSKKYSNIEHNLVYVASRVAAESELALVRRESKVRSLLNSASNIIMTKEENRSRRLSELSFRLDNVSPLKVLSKGYAKVLRGGMELCSVKDVKQGDEITVRMVDGKIKAEVLNNA